MGNTKKVHSTGRYGARYGVGVKKRVLKVEAKQSQKHECPFCGFKKIARKTRGIFQCKKCGKRFAGGAFTPHTLAGGIIKKMVSQKSFLPLAGELESLTGEAQKAIGEKTSKEHSVEEEGEN
ncbi:MAG: 50S ribosomal protein L37ae [Candidatus Diapherotrites archaeon]|nr:50S ribosomal protein L37ae [Candidatus Diapherotrites archaeon]